MANDILGDREFVNVRFKILALEQTIHGVEAGAGLVELNQGGIGRADRVTVISSPTRYILGEDVGYQAARNHKASRAPVILFRPTEEAMYAYQIIPVGDTTASDIIVDLVDGKYAGRLPNVL
jgi:hypothetical protein